MEWIRIGTPADSLAVFGDRVAALTPDRKRVFAREPSTGAWDEVGTPARRLIGGGRHLYGVSPDEKHVYRYDGREWADVGGGAVSFAAIGQALHKVPTLGAPASRLDPVRGTWETIGGPGGRLISGGSTLYAAAPDNSAVWEYSRHDRAWTRIGGPGAGWVGAGGTVYGLAPDKSGVYRYTGAAGQWTKVGGPAASLIGGGEQPLAIQPGKGDLWRYRGTGNTWDRIGGPGKGFVSVGRTVFAMLTDGSEVWMGQDDEPETARLRRLADGCYAAPAFGNRVVRGFLVSQLGGPVLTRHNADVAFQPLSTLKLLPYLHAIGEVDEGDTSLASTVSWVQPTSGSAAAMTDSSCLTPGTPGTTTGSAPLSDALPTMMWESHNRTLDAVLARFTSRAITRRAQALGLRQTEMFDGCPRDGHPAPWTYNTSTLSDVARMFEGVEELSIVKKPESRALWRDNMIRMTPDGSGYTSPITGRTTGPFSSGWLRGAVERERGGAVADAFMPYVEIRGKGGGGGPSGSDIGASDFVQLTLPTKEAGKVVLRQYVVGFYVNHWHGLPATDPVAGAAVAQLRKLKDELYAVAIRHALTGW